MKKNIENPKKKQKEIETNLASVNEQFKGYVKHERENNEDFDLETFKKDNPVMFIKKSTTNSFNSNITADTNTALDTPQAKKLREEGII